MCVSVSFTHSHTLSVSATLVAISMRDRTQHPDDSSFDRRKIIRCVLGSGSGESGCLGLYVWTLIYVEVEEKCLKLGVQANRGGRVVRAVHIISARQVN